MSIHRTLAIAGKEFRHIFRDLRTFFLVTISPAFLLLTLSYIFALDVQQSELAVWDLDGSALSRQYVAVLTADGDFHIHQWVSSYDEMEQLLLNGTASGGVVIPAGFEAGLRAGQPVRVQAVVDGVDPISARQVVFNLGQRTAAFAVQSGTQPIVSAGGIELRSVVWYNPTLQSLISMVPGLMPIVLCMPALALALALAREKETGSFEGLIATPVRGPEYLVGKLIAYVSNGMVAVLLSWLMAVLYFRVPFRGSLSLFLLLGADYLLASMGFSLLIANFVRSQQTAMFLVLMVFFIPGFFVAGLITPVSSGGLGSKLVAYALPASHFITISRAVFLKGVGLVPLAVPTLALLGMGAVGLGGSLLMFRKRLG